MTARYFEYDSCLDRVDQIKNELPPSVPAFAPVLAHGEYVVDPSSSWWNPTVAPALQQYGIGVITGQDSIDDVLNAMDAA